MTTQAKKQGKKSRNFSAEERRSNNEKLEMFLAILVELFRSQSSPEGMKRVMNVKRIEDSLKVSFHSLTRLAADVVLTLIPYPIVGTVLSYFYLISHEFNFKIREFILRGFSSYVSLE